ncbi:hypothetical protein SPLC1_S412300 [Arthrospira platensis C1]|nr:hypothetical protein SPLC1_S412300 [Arthrospira platensis C1]
MSWGLGVVDILANFGAKGQKPGFLNHQTSSNPVSMADIR